MTVNDTLSKIRYLIKEVELLKSTPSDENLIYLTLDSLCAHVKLLDNLITFGELPDDWKIKNG